MTVELHGLTDRELLTLAECVDDPIIDELTRRYNIKTLALDILLNKHKHKNCRPPSQVGALKIFIKK